MVKIEPLGGCDSRRFPPFDSNGTSLFWACYGAGKRCLEIDVQSTVGFERLIRLVTSADVLIESYKPGFTQEHGFDYNKVCELNPHLIYGSITPFGQHGPKSQWPAADITIEAAGGRTSIQGDYDRPPIPIGFPQAFLHAGAQMAADITVALNEREYSNRGQFLDLSAQETMWWTLMGVQGNPVCEGKDPPFVGEDRGTPRQNPSLPIFRSQDGLITLAAGASPPGTKSVFAFALEDAVLRGEEHENLRQIDWNNWGVLYRDGMITRSQLDDIFNLLTRFIERTPNRDLIKLARDNNLRLAPLFSTKEITDFAQFKERNLFVPLEGVTQPANWVRFSRSSLRYSNLRPNDDYGSDWKPRRLSSKTSDDRNGMAFSGLKVADFSWVAAGPTVSKCLADFGATVVKIESQTRPDLTRVLPPFIDEKPGPNRSYWGFLYGTSKLSLQCNLSLKQGRDLARLVCDWADVVIESFAPGTLKRMGLDYETLTKDREDLIMFSTSVMGQTGPFRRYAGYGQQTAGFCGFHYVTGWPDRIPCGVAGPYTDVIVPKFGISALAAAILERRRGGLGQYIDLSQAECSTMFIAPLIADEFVNGKTAKAQGFDSIYVCPQGVYRCQDKERYIAIATETSEQWTQLATVIPQFPFTQARYKQFEIRWKERNEINKDIELWTQTFDAFELERLLIGKGIPASVVLRPTDVYEDEQIEFRKFKQVLNHTECGDVVHFGFPTRFSAKQQMLRSAPPCLGEHNDYVMRELLGLSDESIQQFVEAGVLQ